MSARMKTQRSIICLVVVALLSACGNGSAVMPLQSATGGSNVTLSSLLPNAQHYGHDVYIYTGQPSSNDVTVYDRNGFTLTLKETFYAGFSMPNGMVTTPNGWWYIANAGDSNVLVYRTTKKGPIAFPSETLADYGENPVNVDVTPSRQLCAVSNSGTASRTGSVSVYAGCTNGPTRVLTYGSDVLQGEGIAIDHQGNCYWSFNDLNTQSGSIVEFTNCSGNGSLLFSGLTNAGGLAFDQRGDLYYVDQAKGVYKCGKKTPNPKSGCSLFAGVDNKVLFHPTNINFDYKDKSLWVSDAAGYIDAIDTKSGQYQLNMQALSGDPYGIAPAPGG
jgi:hypothetical protein